MKVAFAVWNNRVSPVFDVAQEVHLVEVKAGRIISRDRVPVADDVPARQALHLAELGVGTLVCGAISRPLMAMIEANGVRVISFVAGDLEEIIRAWLSGTLADRVFGMPGCCRKSRRRDGGWGPGNKRCGTRKRTPPLSLKQDTKGERPCHEKMERDRWEQVRGAEEDEDSVPDPAGGAGPPAADRPRVSRRAGVPEKEDAVGLPPPSFPV